MNLTNKTVVITGVSKGIGLALVKQYLEKGAIVFGLGRTAPDLNHDRFHFLTTDVRQKEQVENATKAIASKGNGIDVLINNAGLGSFGLIETYKQEDIELMFETNVYGTIYPCQMIVPIMKEKGMGHIINISSVAGLEAFPEVSIYCATKHAVRALSQSMYKELRYFGIKVTCVYPGSVKTNFFDGIDTVEAHDYMLMPEDVATMIVQATETPDNFHQVNLEIRPLKPKGPR